jgi:hypothetical protein
VCLSSHCHVLRHELDMMSLGFRTDTCRKAKLEKIAWWVSGCAWEGWVWWMLLVLMKASLGI